MIQPSTIHCRPRMMPAVNGSDESFEPPNGTATAQKRFVSNMLRPISRPRSLATPTSSSSKNLAKTKASGVISASRSPERRRAVLRAACAEAAGRQPSHAAPAIGMARNRLPPKEIVAQFGQVGSGSSQRPRERGPIVPGSERTASGETACVALPRGWPRHLWVASRLAVQPDFGEIGRAGDAMTSSCPTPSAAGSSPRCCSSPPF